MRAAAATQPEVHDRILTQAERLFRDVGYAKTTVADVAKACEMSPANVYRFFESKTAIYEALTEVVLARMEAMVQSILREPRSAEARLRKLIIESHRYNRDQYVKDSRVNEIVVKAMAEQWAVVDAHIDRQRICYRLLIEEGARNGEFVADDLETRSHCVFVAVMPFCHPQLIAERFAEDQDRQVTAMAEFLIAALKPHPPIKGRKPR